MASASNEVGPDTASCRSEPLAAPQFQPADIHAATEPYQALHLADLKQAGGQPTRWLWRGYLAAGEITLLTSLWKSGKTTLVSLLLARMQHGGLLGGLPVCPGRVVVVTEEGPSLWFQRAQVMPFADHICWFCRPFLGKPRPENWLALLDQIARMHDRAPIDLVVVDSLANLGPLQTENDAGEMLRALLPLQQLTQRGIAVLVVHHPRKGRLVPGQAARGSGALSGFVDVILEMQRVSRRDPRDRRRRLRAYSRHEQTPPTWVMALTADSSDYVALGESAEPAFDHGWPLLKTVLENSQGLMTRRDILRAWPDGAPAPAAQTLWKWLRRLIKEGQVLSAGAGTRKDPHRYHLPGMEKKWHENFLSSFMQTLEESPTPKP